MLAIDLGKRFERLLLYSAPLTIACMFLLLFALASTSQKERVEARCNSIAANFIERNRVRFEQEWKEARPKRAGQPIRSSYWYAVTMAWLDEAGPLDCFPVIKPDIDIDAPKAPAELLKLFSSRAATLAQRPISMFGLEVPITATFDVSGTKVRIALGTIVNILLVAMSPALLVWMGSLYATRLREVLLIYRERSLYGIFPHILNVYLLSLPKRNGRWEYIPKNERPAATIFIFSRILLLITFVLPPVLAYGTAVSISLGANNWYYIAPVLGVLLIFLLHVIGLELTLPYSRKVFREPYDPGAT